MKSADSDPNQEISVSVLEPRQEEKSTAKGKQGSGNDRRTKQSKQPNVMINSSEATSTRNSNEFVKMQANHSRNQNRKAAEVLTKKGLESKLRPTCQNFVSEQL